MNFFSLNSLSLICYLAGILGFGVNAMLLSTLISKDEGIQTLKLFLFPIFTIDGFYAVLTGVVQPGYISGSTYMLIVSNGPLVNVLTTGVISWIIEFWAIFTVLSSTISAPLFVYQYIHIVRRKTLTAFHYISIAVGYICIYSPFIPCMLRSQPLYHSKENNQVVYEIAKVSVNLTEPPMAYGELHETNFQLLLLALLNNHGVATLVSLYCGVSVMKFIKRFQENHLSEKTIAMQKALTYWLFFQISLPFLFGGIPSIAIPTILILMKQPLREKTLILGMLYAWLPFIKGLSTLILLRAVSRPLVRYARKSFGMEKSTARISNAQLTYQANTEN